MIVGTCFDGDDNEHLKFIQHHCYSPPAAMKIPSAIVLMVHGALDSLAEYGGPSNIDSIDWAPVYLIRKSGFDHRAVQDAHDVMAASYRWQVKDQKPPHFFQKPTDLNPMQMGQTDTDQYLCESWMLYFRYELQSLFQPGEPFARLIGRATIFSNSDRGYASEDELKDKLLVRYDHGFAAAYRACEKALLAG